MTTPRTEEVDFLKASGSSNPQKLASAIAHAIYENSAQHVDVRAVGAGAVNQAVKAVAIARGYVAPRGFNLSCVPGFVEIQSHDGAITAIVLSVHAAN